MDSNRWGANGFRSSSSDSLLVGITLVYYLVLSGQPDVLLKQLVGNSEGDNAPCYASGGLVMSR